MITNNNDSIPPLFSPLFFANPYPTLSYLRQQAPPYHFSSGERSFWVVTRYQEALAIFKDDEHFVKDHQKALMALSVTKVEDRTTSRASQIIAKTMVDFDPPDHTRLRSLVSKAFTPRRIEQLRPRIEEIANNLLAKMEAASSEVVDLIEAYAFPLPIQVICELLGIPAEDREKLRYWSSYLLSGDSSSEAEKRMAEFFQYLIALVTERRQLLAKTKTDRESDRQDLISALILAEEAGQNLNEDELLAMIFTLIVAGHETTVNLIGNGVLALLEHPGQLTLLQANPALVKNTIEELLRYDSPLATSSFRYAAEDVVIGGQKILKGEGILVAVGSANRDPSQYSEADKLDITRPNSPHLAFGQGIHFCLGAPLARLEGQIALSKLLLERFPRMKLAVAVEDLSWRNSLVLRGLQALPVRLG